MELDKMLTALDRIVIDHGSASAAKFRVAIAVHRPGGLGGTPCVDVSDVQYVDVTRVDKGIDWDSRLVLLTLEQDISLLSNEDRDAITKSVREGQSLQGYREYKTLRDRIVALERILVRAVPGIECGISAKAALGVDTADLEKLLEDIKTLDLLR